MLSPLIPAVAADVSLCPCHGVQGEKVMDSVPPRALCPPLCTATGSRLRIPRLGRSL